MNNTPLGKNFFSEQSAALVTVLILIIILMILSSVILSLLANQTRLMEHNIARVKAKYASEAAMVRELELARRAASYDASHRVSGKYDSDTQNWTVNILTFPGLISQLNLTLDYTIF